VDFHEPTRPPDRCADGIWDGYDAKGPVLLDRFTKSSRRGCAACQMVLDIIKNIKPGWTDVGGLEKKISLRKGGITLLEGDKIAGRFQLYQRVGTFS
jgi:hypothetical protein